MKYDVSSKAKSKLEMHTDSSEITFILTLSDCGSYKGGGTFFEELNRAIKCEEGEALFFEGKKRHKGMRITRGKRYLLVGFLTIKENDA